MLSSDENIKVFIETLKSSSFDAYFWEVKPVNNSVLDQPFEFVLINSRSLYSILPNDSAFKKYFTDDEAVVQFPNLRGDAVLVVPIPFSAKTEYAHLAKFVRTADIKQAVDFWRKVVTTYQDKIGNETKWLSTSGLGVYWLHVRIDSRPKYYQHLDYKIA